MLFQGNISHDLGTDLSAGVRYRPFLSNNITIVGGLATLIPGQAFEDIYETDDPLYHAFMNVIRVLMLSEAKHQWSPLDACIRQATIGVLAIATLAAVRAGRAATAGETPAGRGDASRRKPTRSTGCLTCHAGIEPMHASPAVKLGCTDCHGGNADTRVKEEAHVQPRTKSLQNQRESRARTAPSANPGVHPLHEPRRSSRRAPRPAAVVIRRKPPPSRCR